MKQNEKDGIKKSLKNFIKEGYKEQHKISEKNFEFSKEDCDSLNKEVDRLFNMIEMFITSGLIDNHFIREITSGDSKKIRSRIWEAQLWNYLQKQGYSLSSKDKGPDFSFIIDHNRRVYIEAITPEPVNLPCSNTICGFINQEDDVMLRWTNALSKKREKIDNYISNKDVAFSDLCIIAISSIGMERFHPFCFRMNSLSPTLALKMCYGIGSFCYDVETNSYGIQPQDYILNRNNISVQTNIFSDTSYENISAVLAAKTSSYSEDYAEYVLIHNFNARNRLPVNLLNVDEEWAVNPDNHLIVDIKKKIDVNR